jgi:hypothetical protein
MVESNDIDAGGYRAHGMRYLLSYLRGMPHPAPWHVLEQWASQGFATAAQRPVEPRDLALGQRDQNIARWWGPLHETGLGVVDAEGNPLEDELQALAASAVRLVCPEDPPLARRGRIGFFTHSLVGNALLLLTAASRARVVGGNGLLVEVSSIASRPSRHYLDNGAPVDLGHVVIVRHNETEANNRGILLGRSDGHDGWSSNLLSREPRVCPVGVESWHCSSLIRTQQTASVFGIEAPTIHAGLDEMDLGSAEGLSVRESIEGLCSVRLMLEGDPFAAIVDERGLEVPSPAGESFVELLLRVDQCLRDEIGFVRRG